MSNWEIRSLTDDEAEVRALGENRGIEGFGIVFNSWSQDLGGFREIILPSAIDNVLERSDVLALLNHSIERGVLARNNKGNGSLKLKVEERGVKYSFTAPKFDLGNEVLEGVERGDIRASSFAFTLAPGGDKFEKGKDGAWERTITQFDKIYDMSCVYNPAYLDTTVAKRSIDELRRLENPLPEVVKPEAVVEAAPEPIIKMEDRTANDLEMQFRIYKQKELFKTL